MRTSAITFAIVPVDEMSVYGAKSRLVGHLSQEDRDALVIYMLKDVLDALSDMEKVLLISPADLKSYFKYYGVDVSKYPVEFIKESERGGLDSAVNHATFHALDKGAEATLFVPGDVPLIEKSDVKKVLRLGERHGLVICPAKDGGTGMLYRRPPTIINTRFTTKSFYEHAKEAESKNVKVHIHYSAHFSLDIDTREDIADFLYLPAGGKRYVKGTKTWEFLNKKF